MTINDKISRLLRRMTATPAASDAKRRQRSKPYRLEQLEQRQMLTTIDLAALTAGQGSTIFGADADDGSGWSVSDAGDVNGDGFDDLLIGAPNADYEVYGNLTYGNLTKTSSGESYVIFGGASLPSTIDLASLGTAGITIRGHDTHDLSGYSVSGAGDVNGDGFDDLIIGAKSADGFVTKYQSGESYVIFGAASLPSRIDLPSLGKAGIWIFGAKAYESSGTSVSSAGDVNGDGFDDLIIGASSADGSGNSKPNSGKSYVIFGGASLPSTIDLASLGTAGITILGVDSSDYSGCSVSGAGDVNGDGFDDLIIGAYFADASGNAKAKSGESYVIFGGGSLPSTIDLASLGNAGVTIFGADAYDQSGRCVSSAGDVNGDGFDDLIIGARLADASRNLKTKTGESYVIFGGASLPSTIDLASLGTAGITIRGVDSSDYSGCSVSGAGDVNGDGFDDLIIGAYFADASGNAKANSGESYVIFGGGSLPSTIDLASPSAAGITIFGADPVDRSGTFVSSAGDVNGDGFYDLIIGAVGADASGNAKTSAGKSYVVFGSNLTGAITNQGTAAADTLTGTSSANIMNGDRGNDTLIGNGGADVLTGGQGNDILAVSDLTFKRVVGGTGSDTLRLDGSGLSLNLATLKDHRLLGIEQIDLTGIGNNSLAISLRGVLDLSDKSNTLIVHGNSGDQVTVSDGWLAGADVTMNSVAYRVFTRGAATLRVAAAVSIITTPSTIDLAALMAAQGSTIFGADVGDYSGFSVSNAGDVNGDGFDDLIIGAWSADASGNSKSNAGDSYVVFGGASLPSTIDLASLGNAGVTIFGADSGDSGGRSVSSVGDVNGDGFDDLIIGAPFADGSGNSKNTSGESYVIFGGASLPSTIDLASLGTAGITILGVDTFDYSGCSVSGAGDVNGDGFDDLIIGAYFADASGNAKANSGESYVIFGGGSLPSTIDLASPSAAGITIFGADPGDLSGKSVRSAGDVNGDGFDDLIIGAWSADASGNSKSIAGDSYVVFGGASLPSTIDLASLGTAGVTIFGADASDQSGRCVSSAGDVNGDGFDDLIIGALLADASVNVKVNAGDSYVIFGAASLPSTIDLSLLGTAGITIHGADVGDRSGNSVSSAGDVNGDGFDDLIIGAYFADASGNAKANSGESYVIFGGGSLPSTIDQALLGAVGGPIFGAEAGDSGGCSVSSAGDVNGDGFYDLIIGADRADASGNGKSSAGESYVILGGDFTWTMTKIGTASADTLSGSLSSNVMNGGRGNDMLIGNGGEDVLTGGQGNDILAVRDLTFKRVVGGTGSDTLRLDGSRLSLNLTTVKDNRLLGIEQIDLTGTGDNTLTLSVRDVLNLSDESNTLIVTGNTGDAVLFGSDWIPRAPTASYRVFTQGNATLKVAYAVSIVTPYTIDLAALTATQGATIFGADASDTSGISVSDAGDVNGDGFDDLIIGAYYADASGNAKANAGDSYVVFGGASLPSTIDLASLGTAGVTIFGAAPHNLSGRCVSSAGDVNGDGFDDLLIGAYGADVIGENFRIEHVGASYVIFGRASLPSTINLATVGAADITIFGADAEDLSGRYVSSAGDVNGDGFDDLLIGAPSADAFGNAKANAGESYVIFGAAFLPSTIDLALLGIADITIFGADAADQSNGRIYSGVSLSSAGDVNGDGFDDLIIGARNADDPVHLYSDGTKTGESYVIFGGASLPSTIDLASLGTAGITILGVDTSDYNGCSVSGAGDVNGDGFDDLIIGAYFADASGNAKANSGESYVIFGAASLPSRIDLASVGKAGITIFGAEAGDESGTSVSSAGDVNGDGFDDLIIGADLADASGNAKGGSGESYVIFGAASLPSTIDLASVGKAGITIFGAGAGDRSGTSVSSAGDVNGDGFYDLIIGAHRADASGNAKGGSGESYVIFGGDFTWTMTKIGTASADTLSGSLSSNVMNGGRGNDTVFGYGGADVLTGGQGDDILAVSDMTFKRVVGGTGSDTLRLDGSGLLLSLRALKDNRLLGIEQIDITGTGNNTLQLRFRDVLNLSDESNTLIVKRNYGDIVDIGAGWTQGSDHSLSGVIYTVFTQGAGKLYIQDVNIPPVFRSSTTGSVLENVPTSTVIYAATATDADLTAPKNTISYSIKPSVGDAAFVQINSTTGAVTLLASPDFESKSGYSFTVVATDGGSPPLSAQLTVTITVTNVNEAPTNISLSNASIAENAGLNAVIGTLSGTDPDANSTLTYSLPTGVGDNALFNVLGTTLRANDSFDFEAKSSYSITVQVTDQGDLTYEKVFTIHVTNLRGDLDYVVGTENNDAFVLTYSSASTTGTVTVMRSTDAGVAVDLGTFPMDAPVLLKGLAGTDSVRVVGTAGDDDYLISSRDGLTINGAGLVLDSVETTTLAGAAGDDLYQFDADTTLGVYTVDEAGGGIDTVDLSSTTTSAVVVNLGATTQQVVNSNLSLKLSSSTVFEKAIGGSGNDTLTGNSLANTLTGGSGNDSLVGGLGDDTYAFGTATTAEADTVTEAASAGTDTLSFSSLTTDVIMGLETSLVQTVHENRTLKLNAASVFENILGGSGNDTLSGNSLANTLTGNAGNDTLTGAGGHDSLVGGSGDDTYVFGIATTAEADTVAEDTSAGTDTLSFSLLTTDVILSLETTAVQTVHANRTLKLNAIVVFENIAGGLGNDTLTGNALANTLTGNAGNDTLTGGSGNDSLVGGSGDDTYVFGTAPIAEADTVAEATSAGTDTLSFRTLTTDMILSLETSLVQTVHANRTLKLNAASVFEEIVGGSGNDTLSGNALANTLTGNAGNDTLAGRSGDDIYLLGAATTAEADTVAEATSAGTDTLSFSTLTTDVMLGLETSLVQTVHANRTLKLNAASVFENILGGSGNDTLSGNSLANTLTGNAGNDKLNGGGGNDSLVGGTGDDNYVFGTATTGEADTVSEATSAGTDTISFSTLATDVMLGLETSLVQTVHANRTLTLNAIDVFENIVGGSGNDELSGNSLANTLTGNAGNDKLTGNGGDDSLVGGSGDDTYVFAIATTAEADTVAENTGAGSDTLSFSSLTTDVLLGLETSIVQTVHANRTLKLNAASVFENIAGGSGNDTLSGNSLANILVGNAGADTLRGGGARDILIGGLGLDTLSGGEDEDIVIAGRTTSDSLFSDLNRVLAEWASVNSYATRISNLRAGVGAPAVSLKAKVNVLNDAGEDDSLVGGNGTDWYFRALDDLVTGLVTGEVLDIL